MKMSSQTSATNSATNSTGKWLDVADPDVPASDIARRALDERLRFVIKQMKQTAARNQPSAEGIHQLRVATRRATAALDTFANFIPPKRRRRLRRRLHAIRQAASAVRDLDIVADHYQQCGVPRDGTGAQRVQRTIAKRRRKEQRAVSEIVRRRERRQLIRETKQLIRRVRWRGSGDEPTFSDAARTELAQVADDFFRSSASCEWDTASLHRLRISAKRLRYSIELLRAAFDESVVAAVYLCLADIQTRLGELNDKAASLESYGRWRAKTNDPEMNQHYHDLMAAENTRLLADIESFRAWWSDARQTDLQRQFASLVSLARDD